MIDLPEPPTSVADVALAQEIRQYIRCQKSPIDVAVKFMSNPRILGAILTAPAILSGLSATEHSRLASELVRPNTSGADRSSAED
jgi:hypothetical protein